MAMRLDRDLLRNWVLQSGLTQAEFAQRAGVGTATVNRVLNKRNNVQTRTAVKLAQVLEIDPFELAIFDEDEAG